MKPAPQRHVRHGVVTAIPERVVVMELEPFASGASSALLVHVSATALVALVHGPLDSRRDLARPRGGVRLRECLPGSAGSPKASGLEPLQLLRDSLLDHQGQVAIGHRGAHQASEPLELVPESGGSGELDPVSSWSEGRHDGGSPLTSGRAGDACVRAEFGPCRCDSVLVGGARCGSVRRKAPRQRRWRRQSVCLVHRDSVQTQLAGGCGLGRADPASRIRPLSRRNGQPSDGGRRIRSRRQFGHQVLDFALGLVGGSWEHRVSVVSGEVWRQLRNGGQVKTPVGQHGQEHRVFPRGAGCGNAQVGLRLREMKDLGGIGEHRGRCRAEVETTRVDLTDVSDEVGLDTTRLTEKLGEPTQQLFVGKGLQLVGGALHKDNIGGRSSIAWRCACRERTGELVFRRHLDGLRASWPPLRASSARYQANPRCRRHTLLNSVKGKVMSGPGTWVAD